MHTTNTRMNGKIGVAEFGVGNRTQMVLICAGFRRWVLNILCGLGEFFAGFAVFVFLTAEGAEGLRRERRGNVSQEVLTQRGTENRHRGDLDRKQKMEAI